MTRKKRISSEISPTFEDSHYVCYECGEEIKKDRTVKCPKCDGSILTYARFNNWNYCLLRKYAYEVQEGDLILLRDGKDYKVLNVQKDNQDDSVLRIALKEYRVVSVQEDDWVDCIWGTWDENTTPWKKSE